MEVLLMLVIVHKISMVLRRPRMSEAASCKQAKVLRRSLISQVETEVHDSYRDNCSGAGGAAPRSTKSCAGSTMTCTCYSELPTNQKIPPCTYYSDSLANQSTACDGRCSHESEDDQKNEGVETITKSKATCEKKCQKKHAREVKSST